jgi:hypothetical protein
MSRAYDNAADARFPSGRRNLILNGNFDVWQRGTSGTSGYVADRWTTGNVNGTTTAISQQSFTVGQTDVPGEPKYYHRTVVTSASASNSLSIFDQRIEDVRTGAGQLVTISFYAKADSNKNMSLEMLQDFGSGGSSDVNSLGVQKFSLTSSWQKFTKTVTLPSISGKTVGTSSYLACNFWMDAGSSFNSRTDSLGNQSGTFDIAQMQLELGNVATPFEHRSYGEELALCQRYFERVAEPTNSCYSVGTATFANQPRNVLVYKQRKRAIPSISSSAASEFRFQFSSGNATPSAIITAGIGNDSAFLNASGVTISQNTPFILISNSTSSYIDIDSEL